MNAIAAWIAFAGSLLAQPLAWIAAGNRALDQGKPQEAASDFAQALEMERRTAAPARDLLDLRVTLATAYLECGAYRDAEAVLLEAQSSAPAVIDNTSRAQLLNAWSAVHLRLGQTVERRARIAGGPAPGAGTATVGRSPRLGPA
jgi:tetratricopeptide (TPR) repeat protein